VNQDFEKTAVFAPAVVGGGDARERAIRYANREMHLHYRGEQPPSGPRPFGQPIFTGAAGECLTDP
jgi:hypothetical protein